MNANICNTDEGNICLFQIGQMKSLKIPKGKSEEGQNGKKIKDKMINTGPQNTTQKTRDITK